MVEEVYRGRLWETPGEVTHLATYIFTTTADVEDPSDGQLSLREALAWANGSAGVDLFAFDTAVFGGRSAIGLALGEPLITDGVTIDRDLDDDGFSDVVINGQDASRVVHLTDCRGCDDQTADRTRIGYAQKGDTRLRANNLEPEVQIS